MMEDVFDELLKEYKEKNNKTSDELTLPEVVRIRKIANEINNGSLIWYNRRIENLIKDKKGNS